MTDAILLTRPAGRNEELAARLETAGFEVVIEPLVAIEPIAGGPVDLHGYDWLILTSATGAKLLRRRARGKPRRVAAIGPATAAAWTAPVDLVPAVATQEGLLAELPQPAGRVIFAGAEGARPLLAATLGADVVALYRSVPIRAATLPPARLAVLASPSAALALAALEPRLPVVSIGPETSRTARGQGLDVVTEAATPDSDGLTAAVLAAAR